MVAIFLFFILAIQQGKMTNSICIKKNIEKIRQNTTVLHFLPVDNFDLTRKLFCFKKSSKHNGFVKFRNKLTYIVIGIAQNCDPGPCAELPGLVYNAELEECAWPDEVGCSLGGNKNKVYSTDISPSSNTS